MASTSEKSFGARLRNAQDLATYIAGFNGYNPPRTEESATSFSTLVADIVAANIAETTTKQIYNTAVVTRFNAFRTDDFSVFKMLAPIRGMVQAQYGKGSIQDNQIEAIITRIRSSKLIKVAAKDNTPESTFSTSERSYGSSTQFCSDLVSTLETFPAYNSTKTELQIPQLKAYISNLNVLNDTVASNYQKIKGIKENRRKIYEELADRALRIKSYVKANYGTQSQEYKLIKGLRF